MARENAGLRAHLEWMQRENALLDRLRALVATHTDVKAMIRVAVEGIGQLYGYMMVSIYLIEDDALVLQHQTGYHHVIERMPIARGVMGRTARTGTPVLVKDARADADFQWAMEGISAEICIPLFNQDRVVGVLNIEAVHGHTLSDADLRLMCGVGELLSISIYRTQLYEDAQRSLAQHRAVLDNLNEVVYELDETGRILYVNQTWTRWLGYPADETIGTRMSDYLFPEDVERAAQAMMRLATDPDYVCTSEGRYRMRGGGYRWLLADARMRRKHGRIIFTGTFTDLTERKQLEARDQRNQALIEALRDTAEALTTTLNMGEMLDYVFANLRRVMPPFNAARAMLLEGDENQVVRSTGYEAFDASHEVRRLRYPVAGVPQWRDMIASGHAYFVRDFQAEPQFVLLPGLGWMRSTVGAPLRTKERVIGSIHLDSAEPGLFDQTHAEWLQAFADLAGTAVQNAQLYANTRLHALQLEQRVNERTAAFQRAKTQVETILNTSSDSILLIDERGRIQQANPAFMRLSGYDGESVFGRPLFAFVSVGALGLLNAALERALTGEQCRAELVIARDGGEHVTVDAAFDPVRTFKGEAAIVCTMHDITDRQRIESELRRALEEERRVNDLKRFFSITVSHEFRTPLQIIQSASDKLSRYLDRLSDESRREALHNIETQVQHLKSLLDDIMTVSKAETVGMEFEPVATDLNGFIGEIVGEMRWLASNQHQLDYHGQACPNASIDPQLMRRVLTNLISNAMKYSPAGTAIEVSLSCTEAQAFIDVRDHGIGIPEGDQDRLFEMFHRARNAQNVPGTGLGLAIVRRAVELHGGTISFSSRVNEGTTFTIALPLSGAAGGPPG